MEEEQQLQKDIQQQQKEAVPENILLESPTRKHVSLILELADKHKDSFLNLDLLTNSLHEIFVHINKIVASHLLIKKVSEQSWMKVTRCLAQLVLMSLLTLSCRSRKQGARTGVYLLTVFFYNTVSGFWMLAQAIFCTRLPPTPPPPQEPIL